MVDSHLFSNLSILFKVHYLKAVEHTIAQTSLYWDRIKKAKGVTQRGGGREFEFPYETARGMNFMSGVEDGFLPGQSSNTNDDLDAVEAVSATFSEKRAYNGAKFDGFFKADAHGKMAFHEGHNFARNIRQMVEDSSWNLQRMLLGDGTGQLAEVVSAAHSGNTTVTVKSAQVADDRGLTGTARLRKNQKIFLVKAANWSNNPHEAEADLFGGNTFHKVDAVSDEYDIGTAPTFDLPSSLGDVSAEYAAGDIVVLANSRTSSDGGGNGKSGTDATRELNGMMAFYDDGTLRANHLGLARATYPSLNSKVDLSATLREPTPQLFQAKIDDLDRRMGDMHGTEGYEMLSEQSVRTRYASRLGEEAKRYIQDAGGKTAVGGFSNVTMAFLGNDKLVPWRVCRDVGYGQAFYHNPSNIEGFWSREMSPMDDDGLTLRQVSGKDSWVIFYKLYGELICKEPWKGVRWSNLQGEFA